MSYTGAWLPLRPHAKQVAAWRTSKPFVALACGRGSGKTELLRRRVVYYLQVEKPWPDPKYFYALPTFDQARRMAWEEIKALIPPEWTDNGKLINETRMTIGTVFGSKLFVVGLDKPQRIEGNQYDGGGMDESSDIKPGTFSRTVAPALTHRDGWCWRIGVPKRQGIGAAEFREFYERGVDGDREIDSFTWPSSDILPPEKLLRFQKLLDPRDYAEQFNATWQSSSGTIFYAFDEDANVTPAASYDPTDEIIVGSDFNVDPMAWILAHRKGDEFHVFDEVWIRDTNTPQTLDNLAERYRHHKGGWLFLGDAAAKSRHTSATASDLIQIQNDNRFMPKLVAYDDSHPPVVDRFAATNAALLNTLGERRLIVHPCCVNLIRDLQHRSYKPGTREPNDYGDMGHITDALGYALFPFYSIRAILSDEAPSISIGSF